MTTKNNRNDDAIWHKKLDANDQTDGVWELGFLYQCGNVYVMDNHMAAGWCWLHHLNAKENYGFLHIDTHDDLVNNEAPVYMRSLGLDRSTSLETYTSIPTGSPLGHDIKPLFRYDNYIGNLNDIFPSFFSPSIFAVNERQEVPAGYIVDRFIEPDKLIDDLGHVIQSRKKWILNLDIDYFFREESNNNYIQFLDDNYVDSLCAEILKNKDRIAIITIAMSQYFCGGWTNSKRVTERIAANLEFKIELPEIYQDED